MSMLFRTLFLVVLMALFSVDSFQVQRQYSHKYHKRSTLSMKWSFSKGMGTMQDLGLIGSEGEYYYHPSKKASLKLPPGLSKEKEPVLKGVKPKGLQTVPIFPYNSVLVPMGTDWLNIFEMKHRQLVNDVGDGVFGFSHFSQSNQKVIPFPLSSFLYHHITYHPITLLLPIESQAITCRYSGSYQR